MGLVLSNVTWTREAEVTMQRQQAEVEVLNKVGRLASSSLPPEAVFPEIAEQVRKCSPFDHIALATISQDSPSLTPLST